MMELLLNMPPAQKAKSQQKLASQMPRGTRIDSTGTRLELKGARNYTSCPIYVGTNEIFEDIVVRGIRSDGFSSKLGVKNNKASISKLISDVFEGDERQQAVIAHFNSKRQRSNAAKTVFATMTEDELKMIHNELVPSKVDIKIRHRLQETFSQETHKLKHCAEVLQHLQNSFSTLDHETELLSIHNFQSRGFFADVITSISNFLMQVVDDASIPTQEISNKSKSVEKDPIRFYKEKEDETAAEILLSVSSGVTRHGDTKFSDGTHCDAMVHLTQQCLDSNKPEESVEKEWTHLEIVDSEGQPKCFLVKPQKEGDEILDDKLVQLLSGPSKVVYNNPNEIASNSFHNNPIITPQSFTMNHEGTHTTTLEICMDENPPDYLVGKRTIELQCDETSKRLKT